jgi:hypothetical protein
LWLFLTMLKAANVLSPQASHLSKLADTQSLALARLTQAT